MIIILCIAILLLAGLVFAASRYILRLSSRLANSKGNAERLAARLIDRNHEIEALKRAAKPRTFVLSFNHRAAVNELYRLGLSEHDRSVILATNARHLEGHHLEEADRLVTIAPPADSDDRTLDAWADLQEVWQHVLSRSALAYADQNYIWTIKL